MGTSEFKQTSDWLSTILLTTRDYKSAQFELVQQQTAVYAVKPSPYKLLNSCQHAIRIGCGGFGAFRRFIAFFVSSRIIFAFSLRPQIGGLHAGGVAARALPRTDSTDHGSGLASRLSKKITMALTPWAQNTPVGRRSIVCRSVFSRSFLRMVSPAPPSNNTLSGTTTAARPVVFSIVRMCCTKLSCLFEVLAVAHPVIAQGGT